MMLELTPFARNHRSVYNPFREMEEMEKNFFGGNAMNAFKTDIKEDEKSYVLEADLPGFKKEDIAIDVDNGYLTITAERHSENDEKDGKGNYIRRERSFGSYSRSFDITGVKEDEITASYADGVLTLNMPKKDAELPTARRLEIQ